MDIMYRKKPNKHKQIAIIYGLDTHHINDLTKRTGRKIFKNIEPWATGNKVDAEIILSLHLTLTEDGIIIPLPYSNDPSTDYLIPVNEYQIFEIR